tara:strand:+ start:55 stop:909 length:855 start_codon:yes stop_codon:yes gene_type:complete
MPRKKGDIENFEHLWENRAKKNKSWFYRGEPSNQIEYAFGQHFSFLKSVISINRGDKIIEVGAGRGSFGAFFADYGCNILLTDLSEAILNEAKLIFEEWGLDKKVSTLQCDALQIEAKKNSFDIATSIGLLEHFEDPSEVIKEQIRILKPGGRFTAYVVPDKWTLTKAFSPFNKMLKEMNKVFDKNFVDEKKADLFRTKYDSHYYLKVMKDLGLKGTGSSGVYPYPSISHSTEFPFTVMPEYFEIALVETMKNISQHRLDTFKDHPWSCDEKIAQGFFIWGTKR